MSKVSSGFIWSAIDHFSVQGIQFLLSIIITRLVSPDAFGTVVMVQVFMSFAQVFIEGGFKSALIQKKDRNDEDFHTVFIFNMTIAVVLYMVMYVSAPFIADFYNQPILKDITRVISLNLIFSSLSITQLVKLQSTLNFKVLAKSRVISVLISGALGVFLAYKGFEAWALVFQSVLCTCITSVLLLYFSRWKPRFIFSKESFKFLFGFGSKILFSNFLTTLYMQMTNLVIGKFYTTSQLAYYNRGFTLSNMPSTSIVEVMGRTIYPIFCDHQTDKGLLKQLYRKYLRLTCYIVFPLMFLVSILSKPLIHFLFTDVWMNTAPFLSIFCIAFATYPIQYITGHLVLALGYSGLMAKANVVKQIVAFSLMIISLFISIKAVAYSLMICNFINVFIGVYCVRKVSMISIKEQLGYIIPVLLISLAACLISYLTCFLFSSSFLKVSCGGLIGVIVYLIMTKFFNFEEKVLLERIFKIKR